MENIRMYLANRQSMGKWQFLLAFLAICGVIICILTLILYQPSTSSQPQDASPAVQQASTKKKTEAECRQILLQGGPFSYGGKIGSGSISTRQDDSGVIRNAHWLTGDQSEVRKKLETIKLEACQNKIPVVVIKMRPTEGFEINDELKQLDFYNKPQTEVTTWKDYDANLSRLLAQGLKDIPAMLILEPDLLSYYLDRRNSQYKWNNEEYFELFLQRVAVLATKLTKSWVYLDVGNPYWMEDEPDYISQISISLLKVPGLRGFAMNTKNFANTALVEWLARDIHCKTGLHYIVDTSRNRGSFSKLPSKEVQKCPFDPPGVLKGPLPGWAWGSRNHPPRNPHYDGVLPESEATNKLSSRQPITKQCIRRSSTNTAQDASVWLWTPGLSDGRLFEYGTYHTCLLDHTISCDDICPKYRYPLENGDQYCQCI